MESNTITAKTPWENQMDQIPMHLEYFEGSMVDKVMQIASEYPNNVAFDFMGRHTTYRQLVREIVSRHIELAVISFRQQKFPYIVDAEDAHRDEPRDE